MTNADKLRQMTDEELASYFCTDGLMCGECAIAKFCHECEEKTCELTWLAWLKQEVEK